MDYEKEKILFRFLFLKNKASFRPKASDFYIPNGAIYLCNLKNLKEVSTQKKTV